MTALAWVPPGSLEVIGHQADIEVVEFPPDAETDERLGEVEIFVPHARPASQLNDSLRALLARMPKLELVHTISAGVDWIVDDVPEGVTLCSARGAHDVPVAEWVVAAILAGLRRFPTARDQQRDRVWDRYRSHKLEGSRVLLLGYGSIGRAVEQRLEPFGVEMIRVARQEREGVVVTEQLPELLPRADVVVILLALTPRTRGRIDAEFFSQMAPGALLINAGRGSLIDQDALLAALRADHIRAVLDVTEPEPLPADHPLWGEPGVFITPHVAGTTEGWLETVYALVGKQLERWARGERLSNVVERGY